MKIEPVKIFSETSNFPVLQINGRKFPGVLIQGDTLNHLTCLARNIRDMLSTIGGHEELHDLSQELVENLESKLEEYKSVLEKHKMELPF